MPFNPPDISSYFVVLSLKATIGLTTLDIVDTKKKAIEMAGTQYDVYKENLSRIPGIAFLVIAITDLKKPGAVRDNRLIDKSIVQFQAGSY